MKFVLAPDSFKGSAAAEEICAALAAGIRRILPDAEIVSLPMADGGEGTVSALVSATKGRLLQHTVVDPLGQPITAQWGLLGDGETAVIEMAASSGLPLVAEAKRNPLKTTTYGTGQLILQAIAQGCRKILLGIGGSATCDAGTGMAQALGYKFYRQDGSEIVEYMNGELMGQVRTIDWTTRSPLLQGCQITAACDVDNVLLGPQGAVMVYAPQKGATAEQLPVLERNMERIIDVIEKDLNRSIRNIPGAGAAGGLGAGLLSFADAALKPGVQIVLAACRFAENIQGADYIITGEGQVDEQTVFGKTVSGILTAARPLAVPVIILAGAVRGETCELLQRGAAAVFSICPGPIPLQEAMQRTLPMAEETMANLTSLLHIAHGRQNLNQNHEEL